MSRDQTSSEWLRMLCSASTLPGTSPSDLPPALGVCKDATMQESHDNKRVKRNFEDMMTLSEKVDYFGFLQYELNRCNCKVSLKSEEMERDSLIICMCYSFDQNFITCRHSVTILSITFHVWASGLSCLAV